MDFYINTSAKDPSNAQITSLTDVNQPAASVFTLNDKLPVRLFFTDGAGNYNTWSGDATTTVKMAIVKDSTAILAGIGFSTGQQFSRITNGWGGDLHLNTTELNTEVGTTSSKQLTLAIQVTFATGQISTYFIRSCTVRWDPIPDNVPVPAPVDEYYTAEEVDALLSGLDFTDEIGSALTAANEYTDQQIAGIDFTDVIASAVTQANEYTVEANDGVLYYIANIPKFSTNYFSKEIVWSTESLNVATYIPELQIVNISSASNYAYPFLSVYNATRDVYIINLPKGIKATVTGSSPIFEVSLTGVDTTNWSMLDTFVVFEIDPPAGGLFWESTKEYILSSIPTSDGPFLLNFENFSVTLKTPYNTGIFDWAVPVLTQKDITVTLKAGSNVLATTTILAFNPVTINFSNSILQSISGNFILELSTVDETPLQFNKEYFTVKVKYSYLDLLKFEIEE